MIEYKYITNKGELMTYFYKDINKPLIIIFHGWTHSKERWEIFANKFLNNFNLLIFDVPGFGNTKFNIIEIDIEKYVLVFIEFFHKKSINIADSFLIGHSFGGCICLELMKKIKPIKTFLIDTPIAPVWPSKLIQSIGKIAYLIFYIGLRYKIFIYVFNRLSVNKYKNIDNLMIIDAQKTNAKNAVNVLKMLLKIDYKNTILLNLDSLKIIIGEKDLIVPIKQYSFLQNKKDLIIIKNSGHTPFLEFENFTAKLMIDFFI